MSKFHRKKSKCNSDDVWIEHRPIGNLELNDFTLPILKKRTVSSLSVKDVFKKDASRYLLEHHEIDDDGGMVVEWYKADINPSRGGGAHVVFKDLVKMFPRNHNLKRLEKESVPFREVEERCTISIECHGIPSKNTKKK